MDIHSFNNFFDYKINKNCPENKDERLSDKERLSEYDSRWYALLNKIKPEHFKEIKMEIEIFNKTLISSAQSVNITNSFIFSVITNLSRELYRLKHHDKDYNIGLCLFKRKSIVRLCNFLIRNNRMHSKPYQKLVS